MTVAVQRRFTAQFAEVGNRVLATIYTALILVGPMLLYYAITMFLVLLASRANSYESADAIYGMLSAAVVFFWVVLICDLVFAVMNLVFVLSKGTTLGGRLAKIEYVDVMTGQFNGGKLFLKFLLEALLSSVTLDIVKISYVVSHRNGQHWLDRSLGMVCVRKGSVRLADLSTPASNGQIGDSSGSTAPEAQGGVQPVTLDPAAMSASAQVPQPAASSEITASPWRDAKPQTPAQPTSGIAESNTLLSGQATDAPAVGATPFSSATPDDGRIVTSSPFAPAGQSPIPTAPASNAAPVVPVAPPPSSQDLGSDETVVDLDPLVSSVSAVLDDGEVLAVEHAIVFGRNPTAPAEYPEATPRRLVDESMKLSKTHALLLPRDGGLAVIDLGSRNGVFLERDGVRSRLAPNVETALDTGTTIHLGGRHIKV